MDKLVYLFFIVCKIVLIVLHLVIPDRGFFRHKLKFAVENKLIFNPRVKRNYKVKPQLRGKFEVIRYFTSDSVKLYGWFLEPKEGMPVVLFCPGQSESIAKWQNVMIFLEKLGFGALFLSYRGHYKSAGLPSEQGIYADADAAIEFLKMRGIGEKKIISWGRSLGSSVAAELAVRHDLLGVIMESSICDIQKAAISLGGYRLDSCGLGALKKPVASWFSRMNFIQLFDNSKKVPLIKTNGLLVCSKNDLKIPYEISLYLHSLNPKLDLFVCEEGSHETNDWALEKIESYLKELTQSIVS